jgi:hypothetical protein
VNFQKWITGFLSLLQAFILDSTGLFDLFIMNLKVFSISSVQISLLSDFTLSQKSFDQKLIISFAKSDVYQTQNI